MGAQEYMCSQPGIIKLVECILMVVSYLPGFIGADGKWYVYAVSGVTVAVFIINIVFMVLHCCDVECPCCPHLCECIHAIVGAVIMGICASSHTYWLKHFWNGGEGWLILIACIAAWVCMVLFCLDTCCLNKSRS